MEFLPCLDLHPGDPSHQRRSGVTLLGKQNDEEPLAERVDDDHVIQLMSQGLRAIVAPNEP